MKTMYGLFRMTYDYYEWEELTAVSDDQQSLVELYHEIKSADDPEPLADNEQHKKLKKVETFHYFIRPVKVV